MQISWVIIQYFQHNGFKWLNKKEIDKVLLNLIECNSIEENSSDGYILVADLKYPNELLELQNDYPLVTEKLEISHDMLSNYCCSIANKYDIKIGGVNKLVPNLGNKNKYVLHYRNLQLYLSLGMKLTKVHRVLKFKRSGWLRKYFDIKCKRTNAANSFEKDFFKLMNNSVSGKTMENLRKKINLRLVNKAGDYKKYVRKPSFVSQKIFNKKFVAIHEIKTLDKPINVRFSFLDLRKFLIYEFHYYIVLIYCLQTQTL